MSLSADIIDVILAKMLVIVPTVTTHNALTETFRNPETQIGTNEYPFFQGFGAGWEVEPNDLGQSATTIAIEFLYLRRRQLDQPTGPGEQMWLDFEALQSAINGDPSLGGLVNRTVITFLGVDEVSDVNRTAGGLIVQSFVVNP